MKDEFDRLLDEFSKADLAFNLCDPSEKDQRRIDCNDARKRLRECLSCNVAQAVTVRLEARPADDSQDWTEIFPAQLEWAAKAGHKVRAIEIASQPPAAPVCDQCPEPMEGPHHPDCYRYVDPAHPRSSAESVKVALDELRRDTKKLARELQQGLPKRNAAERLEAISASADRALSAQSSPAPVETDRTHVFEESGFDTCRFCGERKSSKDHVTAQPQAAGQSIGVESLADWFYDNGHEFVVSDEEDVARALLDAFDIARKSSSLTRPECETHKEGK